MKKKKEISIVRSSAAEYLTFITATGESDVNAIYFDENVWLTQKMMGLLYNVETHTINYHLKKIFADEELDENSVIRKFRITASDGKSYNTNHYILKAIIAVGNKVDSPRAVQFRKWANGIIEEFTIKGYMIGNVSFNFKNNSGQFVIGSGDYEFCTRWSECGAKSIYGYKDGGSLIGFNDEIFELPQNKDFTKFDFTSRTREVKIGEVLIWMNNKGKFAATQITDIAVKSRGATSDKLSFAYKIYK